MSSPILHPSLARMTGRDPGQAHRAATPLELLFDLAFVAAFAQAGNQFAHLLAEGHVGSALLAFAFVIFSICWAWINFTWFASAYDTDDWFYRLTTMVQMVGVVILALGVPSVFHSIDEGKHVDNGILVAGYVVMRIALVVQWLRAAKEDPDRKTTALTYAVCITLAQIGWVTLTVADPPVATVVALSLLLFLVELGGPILSERKSSGTPWHPHHVAERYGLLTIIALGEGVLGTVLAVSVLVEEHGWSSEAVLVMVAGVGTTFGLWWIYFTMPSGVLLERHRDRSWGWGYGHIFVFAAIVAFGGGLHVAAYYVEGVATFGVLGVIVAVTVPVLVFMVAVFTIYTAMLRELDPFHILLFGACVGVLILAIVAAANGASLGLCLMIVTAAPAVCVVGYETIGRRHQAAALERSSQP